MLEDLPKVIPLARSQPVEPFTGHPDTRGNTLLKRRTITPSGGTTKKTMGTNGDRSSLLEQNDNGWPEKTMGGVGEMQLLGYR